MKLVILTLTLVGFTARVTSAYLPNVTVTQQDQKRIQEVTAKVVSEIVRFEIERQTAIVESKINQALANGAEKSPCFEKDLQKLRTITLTKVNSCGAQLWTDFSTLLAQPLGVLVFAFLTLTSVLMGTLLCIPGHPQGLIQCLWDVVKQIPGLLFEDAHHIAHLVYYSWTLIEKMFGDVHQCFADIQLDFEINQIILNCSNQTAL